MEPLHTYCLKKKTNPGEDDGDGGAVRVAGALLWRGFRQLQPLGPSVHLCTLRPHTLVASGLIH